MRDSMWLLTGMMIHALSTWFLTKLGVITPSFLQQALAAAGLTALLFGWSKLTNKPNMALLGMALQSLGGSILAFFGLIQLSTTELLTCVWFYGLTLIAIKITGITFR